MPLMMDEPMGMDELQVDDLFGDDAGLSLMDGQSLPSRPPTKELRQRIDELRESGCCQYVVDPTSRLLQFSFQIFFMCESIPRISSSTLL